MSDIVIAAADLVKKETKIGQSSASTVFLLQKRQNKHKLRDESEGVRKETNKPAGRSALRAARFLALQGKYNTCRVFSPADGGVNMYSVYGAPAHRLV